MKHCCTPPCSASIAVLWMELMSILASASISVWGVLWLHLLCNSDQSLSFNSSPSWKLRVWFRGSTSCLRSQGQNERRRKMMQIRHRRIKRRRWRRWAPPGTRTSSVLGEADSAECVRLRCLILTWWQKSWKKDDRRCRRRRETERNHLPSPPPLPRPPLPPLFSPLPPPLCCFSSFHHLTGSQTWFPSAGMTDIIWDTSVFRWTAGWNSAACWFFAVFHERSDGFVLLSDRCTCPLISPGLCVFSSALSSDLWSASELLQLPAAETRDIIDLIIF